MNYCNSVLKTANMLDVNCKSTNHDTVTPLTITTDMSPLSAGEDTCKSHCGGFNPIVGKSSDCGDIIFTRMKSVDSAVCSMFTPSSSLQMSPSSQIGSNYGIYDSTSSSNTNNDSTLNHHSTGYNESHLHAPINHLKSRFIIDSANNLCQNQSNLSNFGQNQSIVSNFGQNQGTATNFGQSQSTVTNLGQNQSTMTSIQTADPVAFMGPSHHYREYGRDYNTPDSSLPLQSGYIMNKSASNADNVLLWQNQAFRYDSADKDDRINVVNNNWSYDESGNYGNFNSYSALNQLFGNAGNKRPITGGHNIVPQNLPLNQYIRPQNLQWNNCYGPSTNNTISPCSAPLNSSNNGNNKSSGNQQQSNNPWNQALVNQKLGLAPAPVNSMNLAAYTQKLVTSGNLNGKKHSPHSPQNNGTASSSSNNTHNNALLKSTVNGICNNKSPNYDLSPSNQNSGCLNAAGDGSLYDSSLSSDNFSYLEKIASNDNMKINFDSQLLDVLRSLESKTGNMTLDDAPNMIQNEHYGNALKNISPLMFPPISQREERFSRKVFVGGLPPDIDEEEITAAFKRFGTLVVDWPHKAESKSYFPPKGYCFLLFQEEISVQNLIYACIMDENKYYWCVSSPTIKDKPVQIRPWSLADSDFVMDGSEPLDPRKTIFVGGVPRPLRAVELAMIMDKLYGGVCYSGIDTDPELKYPKGAGRVAFSNQQSYIAAISARFVQLQHHDIDKRVEVKPYVLDDQMCDECQGSRCAGKFAPFFCANVTCLQYYCEQCWAQIHSRQGREYHKPLVKEGADRPRTVPFRW